MVDFRSLILYALSSTRFECSDWDSHRTLHSWAKVSRAALSYALALTRWLLEISDQSVLETAVRFTRLQWAGNARIQLLQDASFVLHSRQYSFRTHALNLVNSYPLLEFRAVESPSKIEYAFGVAKLRMSEENRRRFARAALFTVVPTIPAESIASQQDATVSVISLSEFGFSATLTKDVRVPAQLRWMVNTAHHHDNQDSNTLSRARACFLCNGTPLCGLRDVVVQAARLYGLRSFYVAAQTCMCMSNGEIGTQCFDNFVFLRVWPNNAELTNRVDIAVNVNFFCGAAVNAIIITSANISAPGQIKAMIDWQCLPGCCAGLVTPLEMINRATRLAASRSLLRVLKGLSYRVPSGECSFPSGLCHASRVMTLLVGYSPFRGPFCIAVDPGKNASDLVVLVAYHHARQHCSTLESLRRTLQVDRRR
mmetsp:Transcript_12789/g.43622  ORF Transcript_12789/g.43622 Transcript_12789/m.43622 type:complete len:425 (+) Transcript_12789:182-1456(+)